MSEAIPANKVRGLAATRFLYDGAQAIAEYDGSNALLQRYVPGAGVDETIVWYEGTDTSDRRFLLTDERASVVAIAGPWLSNEKRSLWTIVNSYRAEGPSQPVCGASRRS